jgi:hypothetical protein
MKIAQWYSTNFTNEQIIQGKNTTFLRFQNTSSQVSVNKSVYVYVIPEILNINPVTEQSYKGKVFLNGADIFDINKVFKNSQNLDTLLVSGPTTVSNPTNSVNDRIFSLFGSHIDVSPNPTDFGLRFPENNSLKFGVLNTPGKFWSTLPVNAKSNYRIDYTGEEEIIVKLSFLITTIDPSMNNWNDYPVINPTLGQEKLGDVKLNGSIWEYYDGFSWNSFSAPYNTSGPYHGIKNLHEVGFYNNVSTWPYTDRLIDTQEVYLFCYPENSKKPARETDYWLDKPLSQSINDTQDSFMLMRTNPKLSGNIKLIVDSKSSMYLESINANNELSDAKYKKNKISPNGSYSVDLKKYFSTLTPELLYEVGQTDNQYLNTKRTFKEQYDFFYGYGVSQLNSKFYDEEFSILAPIWLRKKLPDFFVIFKLNGPVNQETYLDNNREKILSDIVNNAKILKSYDLREGSNIGTYLRNIVNDSRFEEQPLGVNYEKDELTTWNGVAYREGILSSKGEYLYDFYRTDKPINEFEDFLTRGFERNGIICTNLMNFEFLFDDTEAKEYEINRYFGFYIKENELAQFEIFDKGFFKLNEQTPLPRKDIDAEPYSLQPFVQSNINGIVIPIDYYQGNGTIGNPEKTGNVIGKIPLTQSVEDPFRVFYVRDRNDNIDRIKEINEYEYGLPGNDDYLKFTGIKLYDQTVDLSKYAGITKLQTQVEGFLLDSGYAQLVIELYDTKNKGGVFSESEIIEIEWVDINLNRQKWQMIANSTGLQISDFWNFPLYNPDEFLYTNTFNPNGSPNNVAKALVGCINSFDNKIVEAVCIDNRIFIKSKLIGEAGNGFIFRRKMSKLSTFDNITFYDIKPDYSFEYTSSSSIDISTTGDFVVYTSGTDGSLNNYQITIINTTPNQPLPSTFLQNETFSISTIFNNVPVQGVSGMLLDITTNSLGVVENVIIVNQGTGIAPGQIIDVDGLLLGSISPTIFSFSVFSTITAEIRKNGGLIDTYSWNLASAMLYENNEVQIFPSSGYIFNVNDTWNFTNPNQTIEQKFIGGTLRKRNRAKIKTEDVTDIKSSYWFQSQKSKYSRLLDWTVQGKPVFALYNLEEVEIVNGDTVGYKNIFDNKIIQLNDTYLEFYISKENRILGFDAFEPTLSIASFLHVKDFDFDWIRSDYSYVPNAEIFPYYEDIELSQINEEVEIELNLGYTLDSGEIEIYGYDSVLNEWITTSFIFDSTISTQQKFNTYLPVYTYDTSDAGTINNINPSSFAQFNYFYKNYKRLSFLENVTKLKVVSISSTPVKISVSAYKNDEDLVKFGGFLGLSDFFSVEDENVLQELIEDKNIDRFFFEQLISEYDRLRENFTKDYAVKSRVVPYINKWSSKGTDCRDNPYRLNNSLAFGITNFSPDTEVKEQNARLHTHEFYYLDKIPKGMSKDLLSNLRSYFYQDITSASLQYKGENVSWYQLFKDKDNDWFSKYFSIGYPNELNKDGEKINKKTEERYVFLNYINGINSTQGIFRGGKFTINEIDIITNEVVENSKKYEGYKFSSILRILKPSIDSNEKPVTIEFIANDIHKTVLMITTLYINDYKYYDGDFGYLFLYAGKSSLKSNDVLTNYIGDINSLDLANDYLDIVTHKHYDGLSGSCVIDYADIKLSGSFNFSTQVSPFFFIRKVRSVSNTGYGFIPVEEILPINGDVYNIEKITNLSATETGQYFLKTFEKGTFSEISQNYPNSNQNLTTNFQSYIGKDMIPSQSDITFLGGNPPSEFPYIYRTGGITSSFIFWPTNQLVSVANSVIDEDTNSWYLSGGQNYLKRRLEEISFGKIFTKVNNNIDVSYTTITINGSINNNFKVNFIDFDRIDKNTRLLLTDDIDKPEVYLNTDTIGFTNESVIDDEVIFRHRGLYEPKTRKIFNYWLREDEDMTNHYNKDFMLANTRWGVEYSFFGEIENMFYSKVADQEILKISSNSSYKSQYPLINEVAIDYKNFDVYSTNWDNNYYTQYQGLDTKIFKEGTLELTENKSFLGSKVMNVPNKFDIHTFNDTEINWKIIEGLQSTDIQGLQESDEVLGDSTKSRLYINISSVPRLLRQMLEENAMYEFNKLRSLGITRFTNLSDEELLIECKKYLEINIVPLYKVSQVYLYSKEPADTNNDPIFRIDLSESQKLQNGYRVSKNTKVNQISQYEFTIEEFLDTKKYKAYSISILIERI